MATAYKAGKLSNANKEYIRENADKATPDQIATVILKDPKLIRQYIKYEGLAPIDENLPPEEATKLQLTAEFKQSPEWQYLKSEFEPDEIEYFEHRYVKHLAQFKGDILATEESSIFLLIKYELFMHRNRTMQHSGMRSVKGLEKAISDTYKRCNNNTSTLSDNERSFLLNQQTNLANIKGALQASTNEYVKLQEKHSMILKELKATRDQRISKIEDAKLTFTDVIKSLDDADNAEREGRQIELMKEAAKVELNRLSEPHTYIDNTVDIPILNADTVQ